MTIQLLLVGVYLKYLFAWDSSLLNILWLIVMVAVATFSVVRSSELNLRVFALPAFLSFALAIVSVLFYFNGIVISIERIFEAKYLIAIGGMLLGNSLRGNIVGVGSFYRSIKRDENRYLYRLSLGATLFEALIPYFRESLTFALKPTIATMMTVGIVSLPGMMTGQLIAGSTPLVAVKYQIAIMIAIFVSTTISVGLTILLTARTSFDHYGILKKMVFRKA
jgi:putative ABC transport system permease protein